MYNVQEIRKFITEREKGRLVIFEDVLTKCFHKIQNAVQKDEPFALFLVPEFIIGKPRYNYSNCIQYIIFRLKQNGFEVKYFYPNALQIKWGVKDFNTFLSLEKDKGTFDHLAIENKPNTGPALFDLKTPHTGDKLGLFNQKQKPQKKTLNLFEEKPEEFSFKFKKDKKEKIESEKFKLINDFVPKKTTFDGISTKKTNFDNISSKNNFSNNDDKSVKTIKSSFKRLNFF